jgi:AAA domain
MFDIREYVQLDSKSRAICPACHLSKGTGYKERNLSVFQPEKGIWAYKCHVGCTKEQIREALGKQPDRIVPNAWAKPPAQPQLLTPQSVAKAHAELLKSKEPLQWLLARGISLEIIQHNRLGLARSKTGNKHIPAIGIPFPTDADCTHYYQKKRNAPWLPEVDRPNGYIHWSQYGIPSVVYFTHKPETATETYLCEGEWDAMRLGWEMRHTTEVAIACFNCGAGNIPDDEQLAHLPGKVTIFYDLDDAGRNGAIRVQEKLKAAIATVPHPPDPKKGWDITDALNHGFTIGDISDAATKATPWSQPKKENPLRSRLLTNDEMIGNAQDYVEWLVPDILTADELFILGMPPRGGKSLFCLTLALSVAIGGTFLDRPVTQGSVIYVNLEDAPTKVKQRQIAQEWGEGLPVYWLDKFKLSELDSLKELGDEIPDLRLVILDTFSRVRDDSQKESSAELGKTLEPLQEWAKERGICILITHHTSKAPSEGHSSDPFDTLRGSTSIRATCRGAIVIVPADGSYRLLAENGYSDRLDVLVRIHPETLKWKLMGNWAPRIDGDMKAQILDHINLMGEGTVATISTALHYNAASVSTVMARLHRDGLVSKAAGKGRSPGVYSRSSNLLKLMESQFEQQDIDTVSDTALLKQQNLYGHSSRKVINEVESDHLSDHFPKITPTQDKLFEQSYRPDGDSDVCSNSENQSLSYGNGPHVENTELGLGGRCKYVGKASSLGNLCGEKKLTIEAIDGDLCIVRAKGWCVTQTIPKADLKPCK